MTPASPQPSHTMIPVLPLDIIECIVDILVNDNAKGLQYVKTFSLTCRSVLPFCRTHIFSSINVTTTNCSLDLRSGESFGHFLSTTPGIAKYVRKLCIGLHRGDDPKFLFNQVSRQLTRLESLTIVQPICHPLDWNDDISLPMRRLLLDFIHLPTLSHLDLRSFKNFPISHLLPNRNLKHLSTRNLFLAHEGDEPAKSLVAFKPIKLQALDITLTGLSANRILPAQTGSLAAIFSGSQPMLDLTSLEKIFVKFDNVHLAVPLRPVFRSAQQLTDISLIVNDHCFRAIDFAKIIQPSIDTLRRVYLVITCNSVADLLSYLCDELGEIAGKNKLDSLIIQISVKRGLNGEKGDEHWGIFEKVLKSGWPMLKHVSLDIVVSYHSAQGDLPFDTVLQGQFTSLTSGKLVDFRFSVGSGLV